MWSAATRQVGFAAILAAVAWSCCSGNPPPAGSIDSGAGSPAPPRDTIAIAPPGIDADRTDRVDATEREDAGPPSADAVVPDSAATADLPGPIEEVAAVPGWNQESRVRDADLWVQFAGPDRVLAVWTTPIVAVREEGGDGDKRLAPGRIEARWLDGSGHPVEPVRTLIVRDGVGVTWAGFAAEADGGFVVSWSDARWDFIWATSPLTLTAMNQRFGPDLAPRGPAVQADAEPFGSVSFNICNLGGKGVAAAADGRTLVAWQRHLSYSDSELVARAFDASGAPLTEAAPVRGSGPAGDGRDTACQVIQGPDGGFVGWVRWPKVYARRFDRDFAFQGEPLEIATAGSALKMAAHPDGSWTALWTSPAERDDPLFDQYLFARSFDASGQPRGPAVRVSSESSRAVLAPILPESGDVPLHFLETAVAAGADGGFIVAWTARVRGKGPPRNHRVWYPGVFVQRFASDGTPLGTPTVVDSSRREWTVHAGELETIRLAIGPDGRILVAWAEVLEDQHDTLRIRARMLPANAGAAEPDVDAGADDAGD